MSQSTERMDADGWARAGAMQAIPNSWWVPFVAEYGAEPFKVWELGCGEGLIMRNILTSGVPWTYTGVDFQQNIVLRLAQAIVDMGRRNEITQAAYLHCKDVMDPDFCEVFQDARADLIMSSGLLEHFEDDEIVSILERCKCLGAQNIMHAIPNGNCQTYVNWKERRIAEGDWPYGKERTMTSLTEVYDAAGYDCVKTFSTGHETFCDADGEGYLLYAVGILRA